jgi:hypothetical protein
VSHGDSARGDGPTDGLDELDASGEGHAVPAPWSVFPGSAEPEIGDSTLPGDGFRLDPTGRRRRGSAPEVEGDLLEEARESGTVEIEARDSEAGTTLEADGHEAGDAPEAPRDADEEVEEETGADAEAEEETEADAEAEEPARESTPPPKARASRPGKKRRSGKKRSVPPAPEERPAYLASELLAEDLFPATPFSRRLRWGAVAVGVLGAAALLALGATSPFAWLLSALCVALVGAGLAPLGARQRSLALGIAGGLGVAVSTATRAATTELGATPLLVAAAVVAFSALLYRHAHRTSRLAKALAAVGLSGLALFWALGGGVTALHVETLEPTALCGPFVHLALFVWVALAALTFVDPRGEGAGAQFGVALLLWLFLDATVGLVVAADAHLDRLPGLVASDPRWTVRLALPFFVAAAGAGLMQGWVELAARIPRPR